MKEYLEAAKLNKRQNENNLPDWDAVLKSAESTPKPEVGYNMIFFASYPMNQTVRKFEKNLEKSWTAESTRN